MANALLKFIKSVAVQPAWYWKESTGTPDGFGGMSYPTPELVYVRWDGDIKIVIGKDGDEKISSAELIVTQDMEVDGKIILATNIETPPADTSGADTILRVNKTPMFRSKDEFAYTVFV